MHGPVRNGVLADIVLVDPHVRAGLSARAFMCSGVDTWVRVAYGQSLHLSLQPPSQHDLPSARTLPNRPIRTTRPESQFIPQEIIFSGPTCGPEGGVERNEVVHHGDVHGNVQKVKKS